MSAFFRFLHISDVHFTASSENAVKYTIRRGLVEKIGELYKRKQIDCLIISGDIFHRGVMTKEDSIDVKKLLQQIPGSLKTIVIPGNHDLDRSARIKLSGYNCYKFRYELVNEKGHIVGENPSSEFALTSDERTLLCQEAFSGYSKFINDMDFLPVNWELENELGTVKIMFGENEEYCVKFVLLNTCLIAGQMIRGNDFREKKKGLLKNLQCNLMTGNDVDASKTSMKIAALQNELENAGEICIDEDDQTNEYGRMALSKEGNRKLSFDSGNENEIAIFIGHHGYEFLSQVTQNSLKQAMSRNGTELYLCGHAHNMKYKEVRNQMNAFPKYIKQLQAGTMCDDGWDSSQYGFNCVEITICDHGKANAKIESHFCVTYPSGDTRWVKEEFDASFRPLRTEHDTSFTENKHNNMDEAAYQESNTLTPENDDVGKETEIEKERNVISGPADTNIKW